MQGSIQTSQLVGSDDDKLLILCPVLVGHNKETIFLAVATVVLDVVAQPKHAGRHTDQLAVTVRYTGSIETNEMALRQL